MHGYDCEGRIRCMRVSFREVDMPGKAMMLQKAANTQCWEYMHCGSEKENTCPTVVQRYGKACWLVAGTVNGGEPVCLNLHNVPSCKECSFYCALKSIKR